MTTSFFLDLFSTLSLEIKNDQKVASLGRSSAPMVACAFSVIFSSLVAQSEFKDGMLQFL